MTMVRVVVAQEKATGRLIDDGMADVDSLRSELAGSSLTKPAQTRLAAGKG